MTRTFAEQVAEMREQAAIKRTIEYIQSARKRVPWLRSRGYHATAQITAERAAEKERQLGGKR